MTPLTVEDRLLIKALRTQKGLAVDRMAMTQLIFSYF